MLIPPYGTPRDLQPLLDRKIHCLVRDDDIAPLAERRDDAGDGRERLRIYNARGHTQELCNVPLNVHVHVLGAIEVGRPASADTIITEDLDSSLFEHLVRDKVEEVVGGKVVDGAAIGELDLGPGRADYNGALLVLGDFKLGRVGDEGLRRPVFHQLVNFLVTVNTAFPLGNEIDNGGNSPLRSNPRPWTCVSSTAEPAGTARRIRTVPARQCYELDHSGRSS